MEAADVRSAPLAVIVSVPFPKGTSAACDNLGKFERLECAACKPNVTTWCSVCAVTSAMPSPAGKRTNACASPLRSVLADAETIAAPGDGEKCTCAPATGLPWSSCHAIFQGCGNSVPGDPFWPSP